MDKGVQFAEPMASQPRREWSQFQAGLYELRGYSRAAEKTFFYCASLKLGLDAGACRGLNQPVTLVTHGHSDHTRDLGYMSTKENAVIYVPREIESYVRKTCINEQELGWAVDFDPALASFDIRPVAPGDSFLLPLAKQRVQVRVFAMEHAVPCVGYGVAPLKKKLLPAYRGLPGAELGRLRREGTTLEEEVEDRGLGFVYCGDTGIGAVERQEEELCSYGTVVVECTFLGPTEGLTQEAIEERCRRDGHVSWAQLAPLVARHPETRFALIHFSIRYSAAAIRQHFAALQLPNVLVVVSDYHG